MLFTILWFMKVTTGYSRTSQVTNKSTERMYRQMYYIVEIWGSCNVKYYVTVDWVVTLCGLVDAVPLSWRKQWRHYTYYSISACLPVYTVS